MNVGTRDMTNAEKCSRSLTKKVEEMIETRSTTDDAGGSTARGEGYSRRGLSGSFRHIMEIMIPTVIIVVVSFYSLTLVLKEFEVRRKIIQDLSDVMKEDRWTLSDMRIFIDANPGLKTPKGPTGVKLEDKPEDVARPKDGSGPASDASTGPPLN